MWYKVIVRSDLHFKSSMSVFLGCMAELEACSIGEPTKLGEFHYATLTKIETKRIVDIKGGTSSAGVIVEAVESCAKPVFVKP